MIPKELLKATEGKAPSICTYGGAGLRKTNAIATAPYPILMMDIGEGGTASITPWIRRRRDSNETTWEDYSDEDRQRSVDLLRKDVREQMPIKPAPYIDVIHYNNMRVESWDELTRDIGNFSYDFYNTLVLDSLHEFSEGAKTFSRGRGNEHKVMTEVPFAWAQAQERAMVKLNILREFRFKGVFLYTTGSEDISKDYVKNPMEKGSQGAEPYSIRGTVNMPGKLADAVGHKPDILFHAKLINQRVAWMCEPEPLPGGGAWWDGKDRFGRCDNPSEPNFRRIFERLYGKEGMQAIYASGKR